MYPATMSQTMPRPKRSEPVPPDEIFTTSLRLPGWLYNDLNTISNEEDRSINAQMVRALREWVASHRGTDADA